MLSTVKPLDPQLNTPLHKHFYSFHEELEAASQKVRNTIKMENGTERQSQGKYVCGAGNEDRGEMHPRNPVGIPLGSKLPGGHSKKGKGAGPGGWS